LTARPNGVEIVRPTGRASPLWWVVQARRRFFRAFKRLSPEARTIAAGLVLGERPSGFPALKEDFRRSGTIHLLVASGIKVAFVLALWWFLARWAFFLSRRTALVIGIPLVLFYAFLAGADAPVLRAAIMAAAGIAGFLLGRVDRALHLIGFAALVLLVLAPGELFQAGFQMSFAATLGLILGMPAVETGLRWSARRSFWPRPPWVRGLLSGSMRLFALSFLSQLALSPLLVFYFRRVSVAGFVANLIAVPWASVGLYLCVGLFAFDFTGLPGAGLWVWPTEKSMLDLWRMAAWGGRLPGADVPTPWTPLQVGALAAAVAATFGVLYTLRTVEAEEDPPPVGRRRYAVLAGAWIAAALVIALFRPKPLREPSILWVGDRSDAVVVATGGSVTLIDPDSPEQVRGTLIPFLREARVRVARVIFSFPPKGPEVLRAVHEEFPGIEVRCMEGSFGLRWPVEEVLRDPGVVWRRETLAAFSVEAGGRRFLFLSDPRSAVPDGPWEAVSFHPKGPIRRSESRLESVAAQRWILRGRGGSVWDEKLGGVVQRPARDGFSLWRGGRWS
jgi:competence protein ComEC